MKAIRFHAHGGPDVLRYEDVPEPVTGLGEAVVRVRACALNHFDLWQRRGIERVSIPFPHISGADVAGEDVLVIGAGSGVGQAAIQIAWRHGARVFATAGTDEKLAKARQLGAYEVVNHATQNVPTTIKAFTGGRGVDVVVEHVGTATWDRSLRCLVRAGRLVTCGATSARSCSSRRTTRPRLSSNL